MSGGRVFGRLALGKDTVAIRDKSLAKYVEDAATTIQRLKKEREDYRRLMLVLSAQHELLMFCRWMKFGRWLRMAPNGEALCLVERKTLEKLDHD